MRKLAVLATTGLIVAVGAAVAAGQNTWPSVKVTPTITPKKAGTRAHPQGVKLTTVFHWAELG